MSVARDTEVGVRRLLAPFSRAFRSVDAVSLIFSVLVDFAFLFAYGFVTAPVRDKIVEHAVIVGEILSRASKEMLQTRQASPGLLELLVTNQEARPFLLKLLVLLVLLLGVIYLVYCFFQGTNWKLAVDAVDGKRSYREYLMGFARVNVWWFVAFGLVTVLQTVASLYGVVVERVSQVAPGTFVPTLLNVVFGVFIFVAFISYALVGRARPAREAWRVAVSRQGVVLFIALAVLFASVDWLLRWSVSVSSALQLLLGVAVLLPVVYVVRLLVVSTVREVHN